ncbi:MAG: 2-hydroxychromene-2-carboxylate isomerase [Rhodospirillaceae bacterium]|nr:2-hydroxychromene-2-carboxylate isomerase [Rhodospirillaceae bacterium]
MSKTVECYFDYGSPASHLGFFALRPIARAAGAEIVWRPILLGAVFKAIGSHSPVDIAPKGKWMMWDLANYATRYGVPFAHNPHFVINTLPLMRGALVAERRGELERYSEAMFLAIWRDALNMGNPAVIAATLAKAGFDAEAYLAGVQEPAIKDDLKARSDAAVARGVFGVPTYIVGDRMWWGQDRLEWVKEALG